MRTIRWPGSRRGAEGERFEMLLAPHVLPLYRLAYRYTGHREEAEDLVQDLLVKLCPRLEELEQVDDLKPWLMRSLYHAFIDRTRSKQRMPALLDLDEVDAEAPYDPHSDVLTLEQRSALSSAIDQLSPEQRAVVMLHLVEGHSLPELSSLLDVQIGTLKSRLHRAKAQLRISLKFLEPNALPDRVSHHEM